MEDFRDSLTSENKKEHRYCYCLCCHSV